MFLCSELFSSSNIIGDNNNRNIDNNRENNKNNGDHYDLDVSFL